ncbi:MAG: cupin domain-containing protein [Micropepsaceae bacterium]
MRPKPAPGFFNESADGKTFAGVWEATPGAWRIVYDEWEQCCILSGISEIMADGGAPRRVKAGDQFVIEPGFTGIWRVIETTRKSFVVRLP